MLLLDKIKKDSNLIKHSGAIHISNTLSLLDRKISNVLLKNAYDDLGKKRFFEISINDLRRVIGWDGNNDQTIKNCFLKLNTTNLQWNVLGKDRKNEEEWQTVNLLASANIKKKAGYCIYEYSDVLVNLFKNPNIYAKIDLNIQKDFKSKHAIAIWEFLMECLSVSKKDKAITDWISLEDFKTLLALKEEKYKEFKSLNRNIIKPSIKEINDVSNIEAEVHFRREARKVIAISFIVSKKPFTQNSDEDVIKDVTPPIKEYRSSDVNAKQEDLFRVKSQEEVDNNYDYHEVRGILSKPPFSIKDSEIESLLKLFKRQGVSEENIFNSIEAVRENIENPKVKVVSQVAQIKTAVKEIWIPKITREEKINLKKNQVINNLKIQINKLDSKKKNIMDKFKQHLISEAKAAFKVLSIEEQEKRKGGYLENLEAKMEGKIPLDVVAKMNNLLAEDSAIDKLKEEMFDFKREVELKRFLEKNNISISEINKEIAKIKQELDGEYSKGV